MQKVTMPNFYINFLNKTVKSLSILYDFAVAPFTGAWIKMSKPIIAKKPFLVAPFMGAWIKIAFLLDKALKIFVAPFTGVWIKIVKSEGIYTINHGRIPRGCVD